jgi:hypothetical protein
MWSSAPFLETGKRRGGGVWRRRERHSGYGKEIVFEKQILGFKAWKEHS